jgi:hypothetical protein
MASANSLTDGYMAESFRLLTTIERELNAWFAIAWGILQPRQSPTGGCGAKSPTKISHNYLGDNPKP